jgi:DNA-binding response OmpR family regulator
VREGGPSPQNAESDAAAALILVVERDLHVRELERYFLEEAGFTVEFAADGEDALRLARDRRPRLIITEILVPVLDGLALCRAIRDDEHLRDTSVIIFSILSAEARAIEAGARAFLRKPLAHGALVGAVRSLLDGSRPE